MSKERGGKIIKKNKAVQGFLLGLLCLTVFCILAEAAMSEKDVALKETSAGAKLSGESGQEAPVEMLPVDPHAKPLIPGKTYALAQLAQNTDPKEREFFTDAHLALCEPGPCPPCHGGAQCAPCEKAMLYFTDENKKAASSAALEGRRDVLMGSHYEGCQEMKAYKVGQKYHLKVKVANIAEPGFFYNEMEIVNEQA